MLRHGMKKDDSRTTLGF